MFRHFCKQKYVLLNFFIDMAILLQPLLIICALGMQQSFQLFSNLSYSPSSIRENTFSASTTMASLDLTNPISVPSSQYTNLVNLKFVNLMTPGLNAVCLEANRRKVNRHIDNLFFQKLVDNVTIDVTRYCKFPENALDLVEFEGGYIDPFKAKQLEDIPWFCELEADNYCNGRSECLTDECGCENSTSEIFYCPNRSGCITFPQLCDGVSECSDGSDECLCEGFVKIDCPTINSFICIAQDRYCSFKNAISTANLTCILEKPKDINCTETYQNSAELENPFTKCLGKHYWDIMRNSSLFTVLCRTDCSDIENFDKEQWYKLCDRILMYNNGLFYSPKFFCDPGTTNFESCDVGNVCDGTAECSNGADETECPGRFYCSPNSTDRMEWVTEDKLCDGVKDCSNGRDECDPCYSDESSNKLIGSDILLIYTLLAGVAMVAINSVVGFRCYKGSPTTSSGKIDRLLCLQVFFFDWIMGLYNCGIVVATFILHSKGSYCPQDETWRSSIYCQILGLFFSIASHGSLSAIALMSFFRCINCVSLHNRTKLRTVIIVSTVLIAITLMNAIIPILPFARVQDMFRTEAFFKNSVDNPFITSNHVNITRLNKMHKIYFSYETDIYTTVKNLNNITTKNTIFDIEEIGYYGNTPLCVHNVFKEQQSYLIYKLFYLSVLSLLLMIVTLTYVVIVRKQLLSKREVGDIGGEMNRQNAATPSLTVKVSLMIGSQLASWLTFIGTAVYFQIATDVPSSQLFEIIALVVLPINSVLNPIFYSELYKTIHKFVLGGLIEFTGNLLRKL